MSTANFGYPSDEAYRQAVAEEIEAREADSQARHSKPIYETAVVREASPNDLLVQATDKLTRALSAHKDEIGVNEAFGSLTQMLDGAVDAEAAALAVTSFASLYPDYAQHALEALDETWGDYGREVLAETVDQIAWAEAEKEVEAAQAEIDKHISHRADVLGGLSDEIARKDGEAVREVTAAMAGTDENLAWTDDIDATARLMGYRKVATQAQASAGKELFLDAFDREVEANGYAGRLWTDEETEAHRRKQAQANAQITHYDPDEAFGKGYAEGIHRIRQSAFPLGDDFDAELAKYSEPAYKAKFRSELAAQDEKERREEGR